MPEYVRALGQLEGGIRAIQESLSRIITWQGDFSREQEEGRRRIYERLEEHAETQDTNLKEIREKLDQLQNRAEIMADNLDGQGRAQEDLEKRVAELELASKVGQAKRRVDARWRKAMVGIVVAVGTDHATGDKAAHWLIRLLGGH